MQSRPFRILCTEDDLDTRDLITFVLKNNDFQVITAETPELAIEIAKDFSFDLYLVDNWMPQMSGPDLCREFRRFDERTPILFYSGAGYENDKTAAYASGAQGYLVKPVDIDALVTVVQELGTLTGVPTPYTDVLLGLDIPETLEAINPLQALRVASLERTNVVANIGEFSVDLDADQGGIASPQAVAAIEAVSRKDSRLLNDFASACRTWFHTDRVADLTLVGAAFQLGLIPASPDAMDAGIRLLDERGFQRSRETFEFGRRLAVEAQLFSQPKDEREEDVHRLARRMVLSLSRGGWGGGSRAKHFSSLLQESLSAMPGLAESEHGREARRDP